MVYDDLVAEFQALKREVATQGVALDALALGLQHLVTALELVTSGFEASSKPTTAFESGESETSHVNH